MELPEIKERLARLESNKLIDVVKNYRQYGYNEEIRNYALVLLEERGITSTDLHLTGNLENAKYEYVNHVFSSFKLKSNLAFLFYGLIIFIKFILPYIFRNPESSIPLLPVIFILSFLSYLVLLALSFLDQSKFYKLTGDDYGTDGALLYLII